ncbi:MAG: DUF4956 domain-containing protein [Bacteroidales bacterium]|jgi:hypothetical protein|nr:DUF4956 domain-containing protein [Bacteroidales bacterium]
MEIFGIDLIDVEDFMELLIRFSFNFLIIVLIVRYLYYKTSRRKDFLFTYILISVVVFLISYMLSSVKIKLGFALGLFAVFGILRYRTIQLPIKEMTYLFIVIGISMINALANKKVSYAELIFTNFVIIGIIYLLERVWLLRHESSKRIRYDNIELIQPERYPELKADLEKRTGLKINRVEVEDYNFLTDSARVYIYYYEKDNQIDHDARDYYSSDYDD